MTQPTFIAPVLYYLVVLTTILIWNHHLIRSGTIVNHPAQAAIRSGLWTFGAFIIGGPDWVTYLIGFHLAFMFPFNTLLNLMRNLPWAYIGTTAWLDRQGNKWPAAYIQGQILLFIMGMAILIFGPQ